MTSSGFKKDLPRDKIRDALIKEPQIQRIVLNYINDPVDLVQISGLYIQYVEY